MKFAQLSAQLAAVSCVFITTSCEEEVIGWQMVALANLLPSAHPAFLASQLLNRTNLDKSVKKRAHSRSILLVQDEWLVLFVILELFLLKMKRSLSKLSLLKFCILGSGKVLEKYQRSLFRHAVAEYRFTLSVRPQFCRKFE